MPGFSPGYGTFSTLTQTSNAVAASGTAQTIPDVTTTTLNRIVLSGNCTFTFPTAACRQAALPGPRAGRHRIAHGHLAGNGQVGRRLRADAVDGGHQGRRLRVHLRGRHELARSHVRPRPAVTIA
jgi:hypothetical protein